MKKLSTILVLLLILVGCGQKSIQPTSNELLFTINGKEIKEADVFEAMRLSQGSVSVIFSEAQKILLKNIVEEDEAFDKVVEKTIKEAKELLGENYELTIKSNGFESEEEYIEEVIKNIARVQVAVKNAMTDDYKELIKKRPRKVRILEVSEEDSKKVLELAKAGQSLEDLAKEYAVKDSNDVAKEVLVSEISTTDTAVLNKLLAATETGLLEEVVAGQSKFYVAEVTNLDTEAMKEEILEHFSLDSKLTTEYLGKLFRENKFKIYDQDLHNAFQEEHPGYLN